VGQALTAAPFTWTFNLRHTSKDASEITGRQYVGGVKGLMENEPTEVPSKVAPKSMNPLGIPIPKVRQTKWVNY